MTTMTNNYETAEVSQVRNEDASQENVQPVSQEGNEVVAGPTGQELHAKWLTRIGDFCASDRVAEVRESIASTHRNLSVAHSDFATVCHQIDQLFVQSEKLESELAQDETTHKFKCPSDSRPGVMLMAALELGTSKSNVAKIRSIGRQAVLRDERFRTEVPVSRETLYLTAKALDKYPSPEEKEKKFRELIDLPRYRREANRSDMTQMLIKVTGEEPRKQVKTTRSNRSVVSTILQLLGDEQGMVILFPADRHAALLKQAQEMNKKKSMDDDTLKKFESRVRTTAEDITATEPTKRAA